MTADLDPRDAPGHWRCPTCGARRQGDDAFCGRCGAVRPRPERQGGTATPVEPAPRPGADTGGPASRDAFPVARTLALNGILLVAVLVVFLVGRGDGPAAITFEPPAWQCDGTARAWVADIPAGVELVRAEWRQGGPEGEVAGTSDLATAELGPADATTRTVRVERQDPAGIECGLEPGTWTLALRDPATNRLLAFGDVEIVAP